MAVEDELARVREEHPVFAQHFVAYAELKDAIEGGDVAKLMGLLRQELDRVNDFVGVEVVALKNGLQVRCKKLSHGSPDAVEAEGLENLANDIRRLHVFVETNYAAFQQIMKRCAERPQTKSCSWFLERVEAAPFRHHSFDDLLLPLGQLYAALRKEQPGVDEPSVRRLTGQALPLSGEGNCQSFFLPAKDAMNTKLALLKHLRPGGAMQKAKTTQSTRETSRVVGQLSKQLVHVYVEGVEGTQYQERHKRRVGGGSSPAARPSGVLLRCRLAAPPSGEGGAPGDWTDPELEVEVDVESEKGVVSVCTLPQKVMTGLLEGHVDPKHKSAVAKAAAEAIQSQGLVPAVSTAFLRSSFMADAKGDAAGPEVASLDELIVFRDEAAPALADAKGWCSAATRAGGAAATNTPTVSFPGAILRVWLPEATSLEFVRLAGLEAFELKHVPGFSDALHGTALVHREFAYPPPPWLQREELDKVAQEQPGRSTLLTPRRPSVPQGGAASSSQAAAANPAARAPKPMGRVASAAVLEGLGGLGGCCPCRRSRADDASKTLLVDCKTPLAIERTLLRWMRSTVLLASLSAFLISGKSAPSQLSGILVGVLSVVFAALPAQSYRQRSLELACPKSRQPKVDRFMPTLMAWALIIILLATVILSTSE